jgi:hypothetical protein
MSTEEIKDLIVNHYREAHPVFKITNRILDRLTPIVKGGLDEAAEDIPSDIAADAVCDFLEKNNVLNFVIARQPNLAPIPDKVVSSVTDYLNKECPNYEICHIFRNSNHPEDELLYSVTARNISDGTYACWSTWNEGREVLNAGHYHMDSEKECIDILKELYNDITGEPDKYGLMSSVYENGSADRGVEVIDNADEVGLIDNIIPISRHRNTR